MKTALKINESYPSLASLSPQEKGRLFEEFVASLFNLRSGRFELLSYDSENAKVFGLAAARCLYPDLKFLFYTKYRHYKFAIECKWRQSTGKGKIHWADANTLKRYREYEKRNHIPVFIALGVYGFPAQPEKLFVTPLSHIGYRTEFFEHELIPFRRSLERNFFYDARQLKLF
jgi:hypothetical protein